MSDLATSASDRPDDRRLILAGLAVVAIFFGGVLGWAALAPLSSAAIAPGYVTVETHRKTVQHFEGGIVRAILVREGDKVAAGQVLVQIDDTQSGSKLDLLRAQHNTLAALEARLIAERDGAPAIMFPAALAARRDHPAARAVLDGQEAIFATRRGMLESQFAILRQRSAQLQAEIASHQAQLVAFDEQGALIQQEIKIAKELLREGLERKPRLLALQREASRLNGERGEQQGLIARAKRGIGETEMQRASLISARADEVAAELRDTQSKRAELEEELRVAADVQGRTAILAPQAGRVVNLRYFTPGGVVKPGEPILDIVPQNDKLVIEAQLQPLDIEGVHEGLPAEVRLSAFKQRRTPTVRGTVLHISADRLTNERSGEAYYVARVEVAPADLTRLAGVTLYPGMPAEVMILTGGRTALDYLLAPIRESFRRAFREE